jgi:hypothetical protein
VIAYELAVNDTGIVENTVILDPYEHAHHHFFVLPSIDGQDIRATLHFLARRVRATTRKLVDAALRALIAILEIIYSALIARRVTASDDASARTRSADRTAHAFVIQDEVVCCAHFACSVTCFSARVAIIARVVQVTLVTRDTFARRHVMIRRALRAREARVNRTMRKSFE